MPFKQKIFLLVFLVIVTRLFGLNWGDGYYFHPDENNMATALSQLSSDNLNPHFFAYGQFPLYLGYFTLDALGITNNFQNSIYVLRIYSALFSIVSLYFFYKIYPYFSFILLLTFTPGLIQIAHFGTTESLLVLTFAINLYLAKLIIIKPTYKLFILAAICTGIAIATKISGAIFVIPILLSAIISRSWLFVLYGIISIALALVLSPYNYLSLGDFLSSMKYETEVATGVLPVFYTTQFQYSSPYIFQITKIFPYTNGWPIFLFALLSIPLIKNIKNRKYLVVISISCLIYFLYFGQLYVKWTRFMSPLFFVLPLLATLTLRRFPKLLLFAIIPGVMFFIHYFFLDTRLLSSQYLISNLPKNTTILSESGNVIGLPLSPNNFKIIDNDFYNYNPDLLAKKLYTSQYIIVPSRRVFKNYNLKYHKSLFSGELGYQEIKTIAPFSDFFLNQENAEETWSVFDRPTIRIYKKIKNLTVSEYENLL